MSVPPPETLGAAHGGWGLLEARKAGPSHASGLWNWHCQAKVGLTWGKNEIDPKVRPVTNWKMDTLRVKAPSDSIWAPL